MNHSEKSILNLPKFNNPLYCNEYLVDGVLHEWKGETSEVYSTIHSKDKDGVIGPTLLGSIPDMETEPAIAALTAAEKSYQSRARCLAYHESKRSFTMFNHFC